MRRSHSRYVYLLLMPLLLYGCANQQRYAQFDQETVDGLERVESRNLDRAYVRPGIDFSDYDKVMIDSVEVRFRKDWEREYSRISQQEQERIKQGLTELFHEVVRDELERRGSIPVVTAAGSNVLAVRVQLIDLYISDVDDRRADNVVTYTTRTGSVTLIAELYDSVTGQTLARVADHRIASGGAAGQFHISTSVSNSAEARRVVRQWARLLREQLTEVTEQ